MKRIVILISGRGSNMSALARACVDEGWPARIVAVISNRPDAAGLAAAQGMGLPTAIINHRDHPDRESFDAALGDAIDAFQADWILLAGFMRILTDGFVRRYEGRMLNIHPSLLPSFPGLHTHRRALEAGCKLAGATVHFVTPELDHGPIVAQVAVPVLAGDDEAALSARVLAAEHRLYATAVRWCVESQVLLDRGCVVRHLGGAAQSWWSSELSLANPAKVK